MATKDIINITVPVPVCLIDMLNNSGRFSIKELEKDFGVTIRGDMVPQISPGQGHTYYSIHGNAKQVEGAKVTLDSWVTKQLCGEVDIPRDIFDDVLIKMRLYKIEGRDDELQSRQKEDKELQLQIFLITDDSQGEHIRVRVVGANLPDVQKMANRFKKWLEKEKRTVPGIKKNLIDYFKEEDIKSTFNVKCKITRNFHHNNWIELSGYHLYVKNAAEYIKKVMDNNKNGSLHIGNLQGSLHISQHQGTTHNPGSLHIGSLQGSLHISQHQGTTHNSFMQGMAHNSQEQGMPHNPQEQGRVYNSLTGSAQISMIPGFVHISSMQGALLIYLLRGKPRWCCNDSTPRSYLNHARLHYHLPPARQEKRFEYTDRVNSPVSNI